jgi:hypothetical protein
MYIVRVNRHPKVAFLLERLLRPSFSLLAANGIIVKEALLASKSHPGQSRN